MGQLEGKVALITGAGSGFGEGTAKLFAREGAKVVIADLNEQAANRVASEIGSSALALKGDVSKRDDVQGMVDASIKEFGSLDIVINNAAITHKNQPMLEVDEAMFDRMFDVNVKSIFHMSNAVVPVMRKQGKGVIINIGSTAGIRPRPGLTWYNASKGAVNLLSKSMAVELGPDNIRVNAICPVMGVTGMFELFMGAPDTPENRAKFQSTIPLGRFCQPSDVAAAALYLASDAAEFITGVEFPVDGGRTI
ncbi:SDR family oxidoreductase [Pollutimonas harenae]|uniref:SDR family oxidoreductase n=1 Tax=Pollutimonas harenae TaxID=657015 RepID=A0A853GRB2_9BURK|nr:SDR family oxidoreductase [Pollutimonas harenae]NYT85618.1 SDR family oxidoreductase [Pollutimonas harenae]TEA70696.1 glucose 1-dehydrogenase [Pollutimonas harenae]